MELQDSLDLLQPLILLLTLKLITLLTTATMVDGEEVQVYNGPTLDVKEVSNSSTES